MFSSLRRRASAVRGWLGECGRVLGSGDQRMGVHMGREHLTAGVMRGGEARCAAGSWRGGRVPTWCVAGRSAAEAGAAERCPPRRSRWVLWVVASWPARSRLRSLRRRVARRADHRPARPQLPAARAPRRQQHRRGRRQTTPVAPLSHHWAWEDSRALRLYTRSM